MSSRDRIASAVILCTLLAAAPAIAHAADTNTGNVTLTAGIDFPSGATPRKSIHYEEDFYASLSLGFGGGVTVTPMFTAYTSPNSSFPTVQEISVKVAAGEDDPFDYIDGGVLFTAPLTAVPANYGSWNVHAGVNFLRLGDTLKSFNNGNSGQVIVSAGFGFSY